MGNNLKFTINEKEDILKNLDNKEISSLYREALLREYFLREKFFVKLLSYESAFNYITYSFALGSICLGISGKINNKSNRLFELIFGGILAYGGFICHQRRIIQQDRNHTVNKKFREITNIKI